MTVSAGNGQQGTPGNSGFNGANGFNGSPGGNGYGLLSASSPAT